MLFNSYTFFFFFGAFLLCYWTLRRHVRVQNVLVLLGSFVFYGWWDERFLILIVVSVVTDYLFGLGAAGLRITSRHLIKAQGFLWVATLAVLLVAGSDALWIGGWVLAYSLAVPLAVYVFQRLRDPETARKACLISSLCVNLGILGVFKYFNFFAEQLNVLASGVGWQLDYVTLKIILPVGISFYTFQTLSYTIDAYARKLEPTDRLIEFGAFVAFFPQLVAGPIERASHLLPQFFRARSVTRDAVTSGAWLIVWGLCKKVVIADNLAPIADFAFDDPGAHSAGELMAGLVAFAFQIFCDFSGYSDIARGTARLLGFDLMLNFNIPYIARTPSEFWRRWHISLSTWLRDYLYIPLGGNRGGAVLQYRNLALTMVLGGLWHGANWTFIAWGAFHGALLIVYRYLRIDHYLALTTGSKALDGARSLVATLIMFGFTLFGWLLFRAASLSDVGVFVTTIISPPAGPIGPWFAMLPFIAGLLLVHALQIRRNNLEVLASMSGVAGLTVKSLVVYSIVLLAARGSNQFIYFDF